MILDMARELGVAIAETEEYQSMSSAQAAVAKSEPLQTLLNEFTGKRAALTGLLTRMDCDRNEVMALSTDVERLQMQLRENPLFSDMVEKEQAFSVLLQSVDREINACIGREENASCSGNCDSCGGCRH